MPLSNKHFWVFAVISFFLWPATTNALPSPQPPIEKRGDKDVHYTLDITYGTISPDEYSRKAYLVNGQTPGPLIECEEGQTISVSCSARSSKRGGFC
jgi:FtsP/CotA-like multicopper oxidase with cupredoxin domain